MNKITFTHLVEIPGDEDTEHELEVTANVSAERQWSGPTMSCTGGEPPDDGEIEILAIKCDTLDGAQIHGLWKTLAKDRRFYEEAMIGLASHFHERAEIAAEYRQSRLREWSL